MLVVGGAAAARRRLRRRGHADGEQPGRRFLVVGTHRLLGGREQQRLVGRIGPTGSSSGGGSATTPDAGAPPPVTVEAGTTDSGSGYFIDTGSPVTNPAPSGPPGSCTNPLCATDGNECGCTATDSNGNTIQLGCQAGGECGCFENQQLSDQPFAENGTCNDPTLAAQQFLQYCTCN